LRATTRCDTQPYHPVLAMRAAIFCPNIRNHCPTETISERQYGVRRRPTHGRQATSALAGKRRTLEDRFRRSKHRHDRRAEPGTRRKFDGQRSAPGTNDEVMSMTRMSAFLVQTAVAWHPKEQPLPCHTFRHTGLGQHHNATMPGFTSDYPGAGELNRTSRPANSKLFLDISVSASRG